MSSKSHPRKQSVSKPKSSAVPLAVGVRKGKNSTTTNLDTSSPDHTSEQALPVELNDVYKELRYEAHPWHLCVSWETCPPCQDTRAVVVRRLRTDRKERGNPQPPDQGLLLSLGDREPPLQVYSATTSMLQQRSHALQRELMHDRCGRALADRTLLGQEASLNRWARECWDVGQLADSLSRKQGRPREALLLTHGLRLPPLEHHRAASFGPESDFPRRTQKKRSFPMGAFFLLPEHLGPEDDSLVFSLQWRERQLYRPPFSIVRPDLGEQPSCRGTVATEEAGQEAAGEQQALRQLYIQGRAVDDHAHPNTSDTLPASGEGGQDGSQTVSGSQRLCSSPSFKGRLGLGLEPCGPRLQSPYYVRNVVPAFMLGGFTYMWQRPCLQDIVEVGMVCNSGEKGSTTIRLANVGCCTVRYSWRRLPHVDHFNTGRYRLSPFVFNCSHGTLLPEERLSLHVQFSPPFAGSWTERWFVQTTPCLGPGRRGEIPVNLWGKALHVDTTLIDRQRLDRHLEESAAQRMSERDAWDLVKFLPVRRRESLLRDRLCPVPEWRGRDDVAGFRARNPGLHYHSAAMLLLLTADRYLQRELDGRASQVRLATCSQQEVAGQGYYYSDRLDIRPSSSRRDSVSGVTFTFADAPPRTTPSARRSLGGLGSVSSQASMMSGGRRSHSPSASRRTSREMPSTRGGRARSGIQRPRKLQGPSSDELLAEMKVDDFKQSRAKLSVTQLRRHASRLDEDTEKKEEIMRCVSEAALAMSLKPFSPPPMRHYRRLLVREALARLCDDVEQAEWTIRRDMGLQDDPRFNKLATFPQEVPPGEERRKRGVSRKSPRRVGPSSSLQSLLDDPVDWEQTLPRQFKEKLRQAVYARVSACLVSLLPIVIFEGYRMNPFLPKPEL